MCSWCDFRGVCAEGRAAAPQRDPWDALLPDADG
jgi:putative RecB family exonuclease